MGGGGQVRDPNDPDSDLADVDLEYRSRGRPRLPVEQRRREKLVISLTVDERRRIMVAAARDPSGPHSPQEWARRSLLALAPVEADPEGQ